MQSPVFILILEALAVYFLVLGAHSLRGRFGPAHFYALIGGLTAVMSWVTDAGLAVRAGGFIFLVGSTVLYTALLLGVFVVYVFDGPRATRIAISTVLLVSLLAPLAALALHLQGGLGTNWDLALIPLPSLRVNAASLSATLVDLVFLAMAWEFFGKPRLKFRLWLRALLTLFGVMWLDVLLFSTLAFAGTPDYLRIMQGSLASRLLVILFAFPFLYFYLAWQERKGGEIGSRPVMAILSRFMEVSGELSLAQQEIERRRRVEEELRASEEKYRAMVEGLPDVVARFDREGRYLFLSETVQDYMGVPPNSYLGRNIREMGFPGPLCSFVEETLKRVVESGQSHETEFSLESRMGTRLFNWRLLPEFDARGRVRSVLTFSRDVTAHREAEKNYQLLFKEMLDGFALHEIILDGRGNPVDYRFLAVNPAFTRLTGLAAGDIVGKTVREALPGTEKNWIEEYGRVALTGEPAFFESYAQELGKHFAVSAFRPRPGQFACIFADITERKKSEEALAESEHRYRSLFENSPVGISQALPDGRLLAANPAYAHMYGFESAEEMLAEVTNVSGLYAVTEGRARVFEELNEKGRTGPRDVVVRRKDGTERTVLVAARVLRDAKGNFICYHASHLDVTETRRTEKALAEAVQRLNLATAAADLGIWDWDIANDHLVWDDRMYELYDVSREEFGSAYEAWLARIHPEDRELADEESSEARLGHRHYDTEFRIVWADGQVRVLKAYAIVLRDAEGNPVRMTGINYDITEHRQDQEALITSEAQFRNFFEHLTVGVAVYEAVDGGEDFIVSDMNPAGQAILGMARKEVQGRRFTELFADDKASAVREVFKNVWQTGAPVHLPVSEYRDERLRQWLEIRVFRLPPRKVAVVYEDRSEQVRLEESLRQATKMESVGRLAGGVAHDFNNMLGVILGHAEMALDLTPRDSPIYEDLTEIGKAAERSANLTRQLLAFARKQPIHPRSLDLNQAVSGMISMLKRLIGEDVELLWKPGPELWPVQMDPTQVDQILANLSVNARDAISGVGSIAIETQNRVLEERGEGESGLVPGEYVLLSFRDSGCGMDASALEHLFEPFFTTKRTGKGTGLGLATIYGIVKQNEGFITVESRPERGTAFFIHLPRSPEPAAARAEGPESQPVGGRETILLVEDEQAILALSRSILERLGYTVLAAQAPEAALALVEEHPEPIHLLLTDVVMPGMNGRELKERITARKPGIRTLFISGYTADVIADQGVLEPGIHYLQKPFAIRELAASVRRVLDGK